MKSKLQIQLTFEHYDSHVTIQPIGRHGSEKYYAWITVSPTEGIHPECDIIPLTQQEVLLRLDLLAEHRNQAWSVDEAVQIKKLFQ